MFIYIAKDEDDGLGPILDLVMCSECGNPFDVFNYSGEYVHDEFSYTVLKQSLRCKKCGHTDYIVADNKGSYIDMELFSGIYNLDNIREEAKKKEQDIIKRDKRNKRNEKDSSWKQYRKRLFSIDPRKSIIKQIKEKLSELVQLGVGSLIIIFFLGLIFVTVVSIIALSLVFVLFFIGLYIFIGLFTTSMALRIYISATIVFSIFEIMRPLVGNKENLLFKIISWPILVYNYIEFPYIFQFFVLFLVTFINLGEFQLMNSNMFWDTISKSLYPAIVTSILLREITDKHYSKLLEISRKESDIAEQVEEQQWIEKTKIVDSLYIEVLKYYFEQITLIELELYYPNVYRMVTNDFSSIIFDINGVEKKSITIAKIVDKYCVLYGENIT